MSERPSVSPVLAEVDNNLAACFILATKTQRINVRPCEVAIKHKTRRDLLKHITEQVGRPPAISSAEKQSCAMASISGSYNLELKREKAAGSDVVAHRLPAWIAAAGVQAAEMSLLGSEALATKFRQRILRDIWGGQIVVNRFDAKGLL
jgi:hypothetical protein